METITVSRFNVDANVGSPSYFDMWVFESDTDTHGFFLSGNRTVNRDLIREAYATLGLRWALPFKVQVDRQTRRIVGFNQG